MMTRVFSTALLLGLAYVLVTSLPDVARYIKIRRM